MCSCSCILSLWWRSSECRMKQTYNTTDRLKRILHVLSQYHMHACVTRRIEDLMNNWILDTHWNTSTILIVVLEISPRTEKLRDKGNGQFTQWHSAPEFRIEEHIGRCSFDSRGPGLCRWKHWRRSHIVHRLKRKILISWTSPIRGLNILIRLDPAQHSRDLSAELRQAQIQLCSM